MSLSVSVLFLLLICPSYSVRCIGDSSIFFFLFFSFFSRIVDTKSKSLSFMLGNACAVCSSDSFYFSEVDDLKSWQPDGEA